VTTVHSVLNNQVFNTNTDIATDIDFSIVTNVNRLLLILILVSLLMLIDISLNGNDARYPMLTTGQINSVMTSNYSNAKISSSL